MINSSTASIPARTSPSADAIAGPPFSERDLTSRLLIACLFWILCLTLSAAGHRLYKATVTLDRRLSGDEYRASGAELRWIGHGQLQDKYNRIVGDTQFTGELFALPNSRFWLAAGLFYTAAGGVLAWSGRWIAGNGPQSLVGLFAGHLFWLGAIELGLDAAGRRLGLAASLEVVGDRVVGTHSAGALIQLSVVFLIPVFIGLTIHESNRCALFHWFRQRLPIVRTPSPSGRVENYAARTAIQFFMTVWFCYVSVLWLADPLTGSAGQFGLLLTMLAIVTATPYMVWRTTRQSSAAQALRYSVSGAVVAWTAIEIAAAMQYIREPWLSTSFSSAAVLLALSVVLTAAAVCVLLGRRPSAASLRTQATAVLACIVCVAGCAGSREPAPLTAEQVEERLREFDLQIGPPQAGVADGLLHALGSRDPLMRAQAAVSLGKSGRVNSAAKQRLESMAQSDPSLLAQHAALQALSRLGGQKRDTSNPVRHGI